MHRPSPTCPSGYHPGRTCDKTNQCPIIFMLYQHFTRSHDLCETEYLKLSEDEQMEYMKIKPSAYRYVYTDGRLFVPACFLPSDGKESSRDMASRGSSKVVPV